MLQIRNKPGIYLIIYKCNEIIKGKKRTYLKIGESIHVSKRIWELSGYAKIKIIDVFYLKNRFINNTCNLKLWEILGKAFLRKNNFRPLNNPPESWRKNRKKNNDYFYYNPRILTFKNKFWSIVRRIMR